MTVNKWKMSNVEFRDLNSTIQQSISLKPVKVFVVV